MYQPQPSLQSECNPDTSKQPPWQVLMSVLVFSLVTEVLVTTQLSYVNLPWKPNLLWEKFPWFSKRQLFWLPGTTADCGWSPAHQWGPVLSAELGAPRTLPPEWMVSHLLCEFPLLWRTLGNDLFRPNGHRTETGPKRAPQQGFLRNFSVKLLLDLGESSIWS